LVAGSVVAVHPPEDRDAALERPGRVILGGLEAEGPVGPIAPVTARAAALAARLGDVEQEQPAWLQRLEHAREDDAERLVARAFVEGVVKALADRGDRDARRQLGVEQRDVEEARSERAVARDLYEVGRDLHAEHVVAMLRQQLRSDATAATELDRQPGVEPLALEQPHERLGARTRQVPEGLVVHVREVAAVEKLRIHPVRIVWSRRARAA